MPSVFCHRPIKEGVLQEKVQRHKRLVERKENIARSESAKALLTLSMDKQEKCAGTATQTPVVHHCDSEVQSDITLPVMTSLIFTNQVLKNICDSNAVTIKEQQLGQQRAHEVCRKQEDELKSLESRLQKKEEEKHTAIGRAQEKDT